MLVGDDGSIYVERQHAAYPFVIDFLVSCCEPVSRTHLMEHYRLSSSSLAAATAEGTYSCDMIRHYLRYWQLVGPQRALYLDLEVAKALELASMEKPLTYPSSGMARRVIHGFATRKERGARDDRRTATSGAAGFSVLATSSVEGLAGGRGLPCAGSEKAVPHLHEKAAAAEASEEGETSDEDDDNDGEVSANVVHLKEVFSQKYVADRRLRRYSVWCPRKGKKQSEEPIFSSVSSMSYGHEALLPPGVSRLPSHCSRSRRGRGEWKRSWKAQQRYIASTWWASAATRFLDRYQEQIMEYTPTSASEVGTTSGPQPQVVPLDGNDMGTPVHPGFSAPMNPAPPQHQPETPGRPWSSVSTTTTTTNMTTDTTSTDGGGAVVGGPIPFFLDPIRHPRSSSSPGSREGETGNRKISLAKLWNRSKMSLKKEEVEEGETNNNNNSGGCVTTSKEVVMGTERTGLRAEGPPCFTLSSCASPHHSETMAPPLFSSSLYFSMNKPKEEDEGEGKKDTLTPHEGHPVDFARRMMAITSGSTTPVIAIPNTLYSSPTPRTSIPTTKTSSVSSSLMFSIEPLFTFLMEQWMQWQDTASERSWIRTPIKREIENTGKRSTSRAGTWTTLPMIHYALSDRFQEGALEWTLSYCRERRQHYTATRVRNTQGEIQEEEKEALILALQIYASLLLGHSISILPTTTSSSFSFPWEVETLLPEIPFAVEKIIQEEEGSTKVEIVLQPPIHFSSLQVGNRNGSPRYPSTGTQPNSPSFFSQKSNSRSGGGIGSGSASFPLAYFLVSADRALLNHLAEGLKEWLEPMYLRGEPRYVISDVRRGGPGAMSTSSERSRGKDGEEHWPEGDGNARVRLLRRLYVDTDSAPLLTWSSHSLLSGGGEAGQGGLPLQKGTLCSTRPSSSWTAGATSSVAPPLVYKSLIRRDSLRLVREALFKQYGIRADCCYDYLHDQPPEMAERGGTLSGGPLSRFVSPPPPPTAGVSSPSTAVAVPFHIDRLSLRPDVRLRPYQVTSLDRFRRGQVAHQGVVVLPCGAGKTLTGIAAAATLKKRTLVVCVNHMSVFQWQREFLKWTELQPSEVTVCTSKVKQLPGPVFITTYSMLVAKRPVISTTTSTASVAFLSLLVGDSGRGRKKSSMNTLPQPSLEGEKDEEDNGAMEAEYEEEKGTGKNMREGSSSLTVRTRGGGASSPFPIPEAERTEVILRMVQEETWGLLVLDEVHTALAHHFQEVLNKVPHKCVLGLSATLLREDDRIADLRHLVGPKLYEANWLDLSKAGYLAKVECAEIQCFLPLPYWKAYMRILAERETDEERNNTVGLPSYIFERPLEDEDGNGQGWVGGKKEPPRGVGRLPPSSARRAQPARRRRRRRRFDDSSSSSEFSFASSTSSSSRSTSEEDEGGVWEKRKTGNGDEDEDGEDKDEDHAGSNRPAAASRRQSTVKPTRRKRRKRKKSDTTSGGGGTGTHRRRGNPMMGPLQNIASCNPIKLWCTQALLHFHLHERSPPDKVLIFCDYLMEAHFYAHHLHLPFMEQATSEMEREHILEAFQFSTTLNALILTRVGDVALDLPNASVVIQISGLGASRRQEAQRLGRILRPKPPSLDHSCAYFYSLVSQDTHEVRTSYARQSWLRDQGFAYRIVPAEKVLEWFLQRARHQDEEDEDEAEEWGRGGREGAGGLGRHQRTTTTRKHSTNTSTVPRDFCCVGPPQWWYQVTRMEFQRWMRQQAGVVGDFPSRPTRKQEGSQDTTVEGHERDEGGSRAMESPPSPPHDPLLCSPRSPHDKRVEINEDDPFRPVTSSSPLASWHTTTNLATEREEEGDTGGPPPWRADPHRHGVYWAPFSAADSIRLQYYFNRGRETPFAIQDALPHLSLYAASVSHSHPLRPTSIMTASRRHTTTTTSSSPLVLGGIPWMIRFSSVDAPETFGTVAPEVDGHRPWPFVGSSVLDCTRAEGQGEEEEGGGGGAPDGERLSLAGRRKASFTARKITFGTMDPFHYCLDPSHSRCISFAMENLTSKFHLASRNNGTTTTAVHSSPLEE